MYDIVTSQCFVEGTLVVTEDGDKPIEEIKAGDFVYSTNPETGESEYKEVIRTFRKESDVLIHIFVNDEEIETTPVHPFWVVDEWVSAKDLEIGDILTLADGTTAPITDTYGEQLDEPVIVYNFEVQDFHTYYVTDTGVLVHNADCMPRKNVVSKVENPDGSITITKKIGDEDISVVYKMTDGHYYAQFQPFAHPTYSNAISVKGMTGNYRHDAKLANKIIGIPRTPKGYTWHHLEDGKSMILVQTKIHSVRYGGFSHIGGASIIRKKRELMTNFVNLLSNHISS